MRRTFGILLIITLLTGCKSMLFNAALNQMGIYDDAIKLQRLSKNEKKVVFFPIHHIGTQLYYTDIMSKIDSLKKKNYYFYLEQVKPATNDTVLRKFKKIIGLPYVKNGYTDNIDSLFGKNFKFQKEVISQPLYKDLALDSMQSKIVDVTIDNIVNFYEKEYEEIILQPCDFETSLFQQTTCNDEKMTEEVRDKVIVNYRNEVVVKEVLEDTLNKIAIIYGKNHFSGIAEKLIKKGYETETKIIKE